MTQLTGGGGYQYLFKADARVTNSIKLLPGLDTRSSGGYIVAPPSIHPSGRSYRWRPGHGPAEIEIAAAPDWLIAVAEPIEIEAAAAITQQPIAHLNRYSAAALRRACDAIARAAIGQQEATLTREASVSANSPLGAPYPPARPRRASLRPADRWPTSQGDGLGVPRTWTDDRPGLRRGRSEPAVGGAAVMAEDLQLIAKGNLKAEARNPQSRPGICE